MKKIFYGVTMLFLWSINFIQALTFRIVNYSGDSVVATPFWNTSREHTVYLEKGQTTEEYNTNGHRILKIGWCVNGVKYEADLSNIKSQIMLGREFAILDNGNFQHTFVNFPKKFDTGKANIDPNPIGCVKNEN